MFEFDFFRGKKVFISGATGFKGSWISFILSRLGADIIGYSLDVPTTPSLFELAQIDKDIRLIKGDIRDLHSLEAAFAETRPEIVIHMAAQPLVRMSYMNPVNTYETNVMGTVNILECVRKTDTVRSFVNVTTDKVYKNNEWIWGYREDEELNGYDPYSNSKSCSELVTSSYKNSFFGDNSVAISTVRAGNVIGGGDFAANRVIPDCIRAVISSKTMEIRNPSSVRPYQFVMEPLLAYLLVAQKQYEEISFAGNYNVGPDEENCVTTMELVQSFEKYWNQMNPDALFKWKYNPDSGPHEAHFLKLDTSKIKAKIGWKPVYSMSETVEKIVDWTVCWQQGEDIRSCMDKQVKDYFERCP